MTLMLLHPARFLLLLLALFATPLAVMAQTPATTRPAGKRLSDSESRFFDRQATFLLGKITETIGTHPPTTMPSQERTLALSLLDTVLQQTGTPVRPAITQFRDLQLKDLVRQIRETTVTDDSAVIWHVYNMGFIVRTKTVTLGFDLVNLSHVRGFEVDDAVSRAFAEQCDVLFISHVHADHADQSVASAFIAAGKPVVAPDDIWAENPIHRQIAHLRRDPSAVEQPLVIGLARVGLKVGVFPGMQQMGSDPAVTNNVYVITTPEGLRVAHLGDNNVAAGLPAADRAFPGVDVLFIKLEPGGINSAQIVRAFAPRLAIPSHFQELGHGKITAREPYWRGLDRASKLGVPAVVMTWGERFDYVRARE